MKNFVYEKDYFDTPLNTTSKNGKITWPKIPSVKQYFCLPDSLIYHITKNPRTPKIYYKLHQSCKYFFEKHPLLLVGCIFYNGKRMCSYYKLYQKHKNNKHCCANLDVNKITSKIWLFGEIRLGDKFFLNDDDSLSLLSKLYPAENSPLHITNAKITFDVFKLWASRLHSFYLEKTTVFDNDGIPVMLEKIIESIPNIKDFYYTFDIETPAASPTTIKSIIKLKNIGNIYLGNIPEICTTEDIYALITKFKDTKICLQFLWNIQVEYRNQLKELVDTIIESNFHNCVLRYYGQDEEKLKIMRNRIDM